MNRLGICGVQTFGLILDTPKGGRWPWKLAPAKECVTTHQPNPPAPKMDDASAQFVIAHYSLGKGGVAAQSQTGVKLNRVFFPRLALQVRSLDCRFATPAVYPRVGESRHIDIQSTGQKSVCDIHHLVASQTYVLIVFNVSPLDLCYANQDLH